MSITRNFSIQAQGLAKNFVADSTARFVGDAVNRLLGRPSPFGDKNRRLGTLTNSPYSKYKLPVKSFVQQDFTQETTGTTSLTRKSDSNLFPKDTITQKTDWRIRITPGPTLESTYFTTKWLIPLEDTKGVVFPYTPQIAITHSASYQTTPLTHANFQHYSYSNSDINAISISGDFTAQNVAEGRYVLAALHFFRSVTKMFFGSDSDPVAGTPPPVLFLHGLGPQILNGVPVVVTSFTSSFPADTDYLLVDGNRIPTMMTMAIMVQPVYNRRQSLTYSSREFINGNLLSKGYI